MYRPMTPCRFTICLMASIVPRRDWVLKEGFLAASGAAWARFDIRTEVWTTFLASSKGPVPYISQTQTESHMMKSLQAMGEAARPATRPAPVKVKTPATVGVLPGFPNSSRGEVPVRALKRWSMYPLAPLYVVKLTTRTTVTLASGGSDPTESVNYQSDLIGL